MTKILTDAATRRLKAPESGQADHFDAGYPGLAIRVSSTGARSFVHLYRLGGRLRRRTLGRYPALTLSGAREMWRSDREMIARGVDPADAAEDAKRAVIAEAAARRASTYGAAVDDYVDRFQRGERGNATAGEVRRVLLKEGSAWIALPLADITPSMVRRLLEDVRDGRGGADPRPYLANRLFAYARTFFGWCAAPGIDLVKVSPMIGLSRPWAGEEVRTRVFEDAEIRSLWLAADSLGVYAGAFLRLLLLTGKRKSALASMRWEHITDGTWSPPQPKRRRAGNKRLHSIPLPGAALSIIEGLPRLDDNPFVFASARRTGQPLTAGTVLQRRIAATSGVGGFFFHAIRHTVETKMADLHILPHVRDLLLDHAPARGAGAGYDHASYRGEMAGALEAWARYVAGLLSGEPAGNVVELKRPA